MLRYLKHVWAHCNCEKCEQVQKSNIFRARLPQKLLLFRFARKRQKIWKFRAIKAINYRFWLQLAAVWLQLAAVKKKCSPRYTLTQNLGGGATAPPLLPSADAHANPSDNLVGEVEFWDAQRVIRLDQAVSTNKKGRVKITNGAFSWRREKGRRVGGV